MRRTRLFFRYISVSGENNFGTNIANMCQSVSILLAAPIKYNRRAIHSVFVKHAIQCTHLRQSHAIRIDDLSVLLVIEHKPTTDQGIH